MKVVFNCVDCGVKHNSDFKHLNKRTRIKTAHCPKCVMLMVGKDKEWLKGNSDAQKISQAAPKQRQKNSDGVAKFWR